MSEALNEWRSSSCEVFDGIEVIHGKVEANEVGRSLMIQQVNYAYAVLITAHFQRYCRALHTEATQSVIGGVPDPAFAEVVERLLSRKRLIDKGNPTPRNLGTDFDRFGFKLWDDVEARDRRNRKRRHKLDHLCEWRNGITHGVISEKRSEGRLSPPNLTLGTCKDWRRALGALAESMDSVIAMQCQALGRQRPW